MEQLLCSYLISHKQCPIPGIGRLVLKETPAEINITEKLVTPPTSRLELDKSFDEENDLVNYVAAGKSVTRLEAERMLEEYSSNIKYLPSHSSFQFGKLGKFYRDAQGVLFFKDHTDDTAFFEAVNAEKIIRPNERHNLLVGDRETTNADMSEFYGTEAKISRKKWWIGALVIVVISATLIVLHYMKWKNSGMGNHQPF